jgi:stage 0 sporulation regulatory protein
MKVIKHYVYDVKQEGIVVKVQIIEIDERLLEKIEGKKKRLVQFASQFELTDRRVVKCSQELDMLLNQYQLRLNLHLEDHTSKTKLEQIGKEREFIWGF